MAKNLWMVVSTPLKNISQIGNLPQVGMKIKISLKPPPKSTSTNPTFEAFPARYPKQYDAPRAASRRYVPELTLPMVKAHDTNLFVSFWVV